MIRVSPLVLLLLCQLVSSGCGTSAFLHRFEITVEDPGGRLGPPPIEMAIFNQQMGSSEEYARRTMGTWSPGAPFLTTYSSVETKMLFDSSPARRITAALWLPAYEKSGYFHFITEPTADAEVTMTLPFAPWGEYSSAGTTVTPLTARVRAEADGSVWVFHVTLQIPPG